VVAGGAGAGEVVIARVGGAGGLAMLMRAPIGDVGAREHRVSELVTAGAGAGELVVARLQTGDGGARAPPAMVARRVGGKLVTPRECGAGEVVNAHVGGAGKVEIARGLVPVGPATLRAGRTSDGWARADGVGEVVIARVGARAMSWPCARTARARP
jgi:hypothetical protein